MTPELIGILAMGGTLAGLMLALWRDTRADIHALRADNQALRTEVRADIQNLRAEVRADLGDLRKDVPVANRAHVPTRRCHRRPLRRDVPATATTMPPDRPGANGERRLEPNDVLARG